MVTGRGARSDTGRRLDGAADVLNGFGGVALDGEAEAEIARALEACAQRARAIGGARQAGGEAEIEAAAGDPGGELRAGGRPREPVRRGAAAAGG